MRWFKHYSNADHSDGLTELILKGGFEAYGRYWRLLEFLSSRFDGECVNFTFHSSIIRQLLRLRSATNLGSFVDLTATIRGIKIELIGNDVKIYSPILLDLKDRDFKKSRNEREQSAPKNKNKNKIENKNKKIIKKENSAPEKSGLDLDFDFEKIYNAYPRKEGKTKGLEKLKREIKTDEDYQSLKEAVKNYSDQTQGQDKKYIKLFSSFVSVWRDYLEPEQFGDPSELARKKLVEGIVAEEKAFLESGISIQEHWARIRREKFGEVAQ